MSQDAQGTPTIPTKKPTNISTLKSIPLLKDINMNSGSPYNDGQDKLPEYSKYILTRKQSVIDEKKSDIYQNLINAHKNRYDPDTNDEAMENINKVKDYKWKIGMILIDRINSLKNEISEKRKEIENKKKEFEKKNAYKERIIYLKKLIKKEEAELYPQEYNTNSILKEKKKDLERQINEIENNKNNLKNTMIKKYQTMLELKDNLSKSLRELTLVEDQINSRKFIYEQEELQKEKEQKRIMSQKLFPKREKELNLSQNIGEYINHTLLIKNNSDKI
jgi:hypothetical protein